MLNGIKEIEGGVFVAVNNEGEEIHVGDDVLYEMHSGSRFLWKAAVTKISPCGVSVLEEGETTSILLDPYNVFKEKYPTHKTIVCK